MNPFKDLHVEMVGSTPTHLLSDIEEIPGVLLHIIREDADRLALVNDDGWIHFAFYEWAASDDEDSYMQLIFRGEGPGGEGHPLRECRHIWWGEDGYTFYLPLKSTQAALKILERYFDDH